MGDLGQLLLFFIFLAVWIVDSFVFKYSTFLSHFVPLPIRLGIAFLILIFAGYLARSGMHIVFGKVRETPEVIREGAFNLIRHPIYVGAVLLYLGLIIATFSLASMVVWIGILFFYQFISRYEEKLLLNKFGDEYEQYMRDVPRWLPRLKIGI